MHFYQFLYVLRVGYITGYCKSITSYRARKLFLIILKIFDKSLLSELHLGENVMNSKENTDLCLLDVALVSDKNNKIKQTLMNTNQNLQVISHRQEIFY